MKTNVHTLLLPPTTHRVIGTRAIIGRGSTRAVSPSGRPVAPSPGTRRPARKHLLNLVIGLERAMHLEGFHRRVGRKGGRGSTLPDGMRGKGHTRPTSAGEGQFWERGTNLALHRPASLFLFSSYGEEGRVVIVHHKGYGVYIVHTYVLCMHTCSRHGTERSDRSCQSILFLGDGRPRDWAN